MPYPVVHVPFLPAYAMALFPFILIKEESLRHDAVYIRHETIHLKQQLELLIIPFYVLYLFNYLINRFKYRTHDAAYRNIIFEREAYRHETEPHYLKSRKPWAWLQKQL